MKNFRSNSTGVMSGRGSQHGKASLFNSYEVGLNSSLTYPRIVPGFLPQLPRTRKYPAYTRFQLGANLMNRPHYFRMVSFNGSMSYDYRTSLRAGHSVTPFKLVYTKLLNTTESFDQFRRFFFSDGNSEISSFLLRVTPILTTPHTAGKWITALSGSSWECRLEISLVG